MTRPPRAPGNGTGIVRVSARPHAFKIDRVDLEVPTGATLAEIVADAIASEAARPWATVSIGGHVVPRENWHRVRPKPGVLIEVRAGLGFGEGKSPLRTVLTIAVIAAAAYVSGGALAGLLGPGTFAAGSFSAGVAAAGVAVVGGMIVSGSLPEPA